MFSPSTQGQISSSGLIVPRSLYITQKKINPFPALSADTPQRQRGRTEAQANNVTFLPIAATHSKDTSGQCDHVTGSC